MKNLEVYKIAVKLSDSCWEIYKDLPNNLKYHIGNQFIDSADSVAANIAEGSGRFHYLDTIKFYYNSRGSLNETEHWMGTLRKRELITEEKYQNLQKTLRDLNVKLNNLISSIKKQRFTDTKKEE